MRSAVNGLVRVAFGAFVALVGSVGLAAQTAPTATPGLTLEEALSLALANNKTIAAARLQRPVDVAGVDVARERPNPDVLYEAARDTPHQAITASFPLELGGKRGARTAAAEAVVATGEAELHQLIATVRDDVRRTYIGLAAAERKVAIAQEVADLFTRARDAAHARALAGDAPRRDDVAAQVDWFGAQNDVVAAQGEVDAIRASLNVLLGRPPSSALSLATTLEPVPVPTLEAALARTAQVNTDVEVIDRRIAEQTARIGVAHALQTPDLTAGVGVTFEAAPDFSVGWRASADIAIPLFTTHRAGVVVETAALTKLRADREALLADISGAVAAALARAASAATRYTTYQRDILPLSQQDEAFAQDAYQSGQTGLDALILALQRARDRRLAGLQAALDFHNALADLERAITGPIR
jgi:cobalt-zinc-cadmium efflux system outer membrane protein